MLSHPLDIDKKAAGQRLKLFLDARFKSANEAGTALGTSGDSLRNSYFNGNSLPGARLLAQLNSMGCSVDWLLFGDQNSGKYTIRENKERSLIPYPEINHIVPSREFRVIGSIPAGKQGEVIIHDYITTEVIDLDPNNTDLLLVDEEFGHSMTPLMKPGDLVAIDYRSKVYNGCIVAAKWDRTKGAVKILSINESDPTWVTLLSYNMAIPPINVKRNKVVMYHVFWWIDRARLKKHIK